MIYLITNRPEAYKLLKDNTVISDINKFISWTTNRTWYQLDVETLMVENTADALEDRKLVLVQIGDIEKEDQWLFEIEVIYTDNFIHSILKQLLESINNTFIAHNAKFEYTVIYKFLNIRTENLHDTFLMSKILNTGLDLEKGYHGLAGCLNRFFGIEMDKTQQTTFTFEVLNNEQIQYAADDVVYMYDLYLKLKELLESWDLWYLYNRVERQVLKVFGDMELTPMRFDMKFWDKLIISLEKDDEEALKALNITIFEDEKLVNYLKNSNKILGLSLIQPKDIVTISWASNITRKTILQKIIPELKDINKFTKPELKKIYKANALSFISSKLLNLYLERNFSSLNRYLRIYFKPWLIDNGYYLPKNNLNLNWNSYIHRLYIFQFYYPNLKDTNAKSLARIYTNKLINQFKKYSKVHKSRTTYGAGFKKKYVRRNNTIALSNVKQILNTGRIAGSILLQLPAQARFRNAFLPSYEDWLFVDSDYDSAELCCMAYMAQEEKLLQVIRDKKDAHMHVSQSLFPKEWAEVAEDNCIHLTTGKRCSCIKHNEMRKKGKTFNFGIPFGMTYIGLADRLDISRSEAKEMLNKYFMQFPNLKKFFDASETEGIANNYIVGAPPTKRIRFYHSPSNEGERLAIGRESKNLKIQEMNASMTKIALIKLRRYILDNNFPAVLNMPVHDQILSSCAKDYVDEWESIQEKAMTEAADLFLENGLLTVDTNILDRWTK